ncbi:EAL domain-containing protein [Kineococcus auxinigenes]|uniref:EAL domain-containing protein n=1 Tax=unclassified Kineococcus TaxID=2621656 RepID=UPI003D7EDB60
MRPATALRVVHQPIVDLRTREVVAVEGLVRGTRRTGPPGGADAADVPPQELFAAARAQGADALVRLDEACVRATLGTAAGLAHPATLFVNVEPVTLARLSRPVLAELAALLPPHVRVVVEVTERELLRQPAQLLAGVGRVREVGWAVALDDVGAEPAALALMPFLQPEVIKLDLELVRTRPTLQVAAIVNAVNAQAERTGARVLAEGIETQEHLQRALGLGAVLGQGWHFGRPGPLPGRWGTPLRVAAAAPGTVESGATAFGLLAGTAPVQRAGVALLSAVTRQVERQAMLLDEMTVVLACFQDVAALSAGTLRRYEALAATTGLTVVLGPGVSTSPGTGVHGAPLHPEDPQAREWVVTVVSPHFAAAVAARDTAPAVRGTPRVLEYVLTYDRERVVAAAGLLMTRVDAGPRPVTARPGPPVVAGGGVAAQVAPHELPDLLIRAIATAQNGITIADARLPDTPLVHVNAAFERLTGYAAHEVLGRNCRFLQGPGTDRDQVAVIARRLRAGRPVRVTLLNHRRDGSTFWNEVSISPVTAPDGTVTHFIGNQVDVSDHVERRHRAGPAAHHDPLTGLAGRARALEHLDLALRHRARGAADLAVVLVDLEGFGAVNDRLGRAGGDHVLIAASQRLRSLLRDGDLLARVGGDEFLLVLPGLPPGEDAVQRVLRDLHGALSGPVQVDGSAVDLRAGTGCATAPRDAGDAATLVDLAHSRVVRGAGRRGD